MALLIVELRKQWWPGICICRKEIGIQEYNILHITEKATRILHICTAPQFTILICEKKKRNPNWSNTYIYFTHYQQPERVTTLQLGHSHQTLTHLLVASIVVLESAGTAPSLMRLYLLMIYLVGAVSIHGGRAVLIGWFWPTISAASTSLISLNAVHRVIKQHELNN